MNDLGLPPELDQLERALLRGPRPRPSAELRDRVLDEVKVELRKARVASWRRAALAAAAMLLLGSGLLFGVSRATMATAPRADEPPSVSEIARRLQCLSPELRDEDSMRQAATRQIGVEKNKQTSLGGLIP